MHEPMYDCYSGSPLCLLCMSSIVVPAATVLHICRCCLFCKPYLAICFVCDFAFCFRKHDIAAYIDECEVKDKEKVLGKDLQKYGSRSGRPEIAIIPVSGTYDAHGMQRGMLTASHIVALALQPSQDALRLMHECQPLALH